MLRVAALLLLASCASRHVVKGEAALEAGDARGALSSFEAALAEGDDARARDGRNRALSTLIDRALSEAAAARTSGRWIVAATALADAQTFSDAGAGHATRVTIEREALANAVAPFIREPLALGQALESEARLSTVKPALERAHLESLLSDLEKEIRSVGARRCAVLSPLARTPWLARFMAGYCVHFKASATPVPPMPERRSSIALRVDALKARPQLQPALERALIQGLQRSPWYEAKAAGAIPVQVNGSIESERSAEPINAFVEWTESETYPTTETVTENYTETYSATENRPYQRMYTENESYTYSCGSGTRYQTCTGYRTVTRYRTEYRMETVMKTRPATRQVTKTVYKTRPVARRFDYPATHVKTRNAGVLTLALALPATTAPLSVQVKDEANTEDLEHQATHAPAKLTPHVAVVVDAVGFEDRMLTALQQKVRVALEAAWVTSLCPGDETPESAARCVVSQSAPSAAWLPLERFTGERAEQLRLLEVP
ncbi:MAG: hypothetical protein GQE15_19645 [Archangiaceae bacterium]|nr:hypothetical protein [Archangiaceae bacterium]